MGDTKQIGVNQEVLNTNSEVEFILNAIARDYLLKAAPEDATTADEIARDKHGVVHSCSVAACVAAFYKLHRKYNKEADRIDNQILKMLQIAAMFHDAGRASDDDCDCRKWEEQSRTLAENYLIHLGFEENLSKLVASAIVYAEYPTEIEGLELDTDNKNLLKILSEILHDADSANYLRFGNSTVFDIDKLNIYRQINATYQRISNLQKEAHQSLSKVLKAIMQFQAHMGDSRGTYSGIKALGDSKDDMILGCYNPDIKKQYESDTNPYSKIAAVFCQQEVLAELYDSFVELPIVKGEPDDDGKLKNKALDFSVSECLFENTKRPNPYGIEAHNKACIVFRGDGRGLEKIKNDGGMHPYCVHDDTRTDRDDLDTHTECYDLLVPSLGFKEKSSGIVYATTNATLASTYANKATSSGTGNSYCYMLKAQTVITKNECKDINIDDICAVPGGFDYGAILAVKEGAKILISKRFLARHGDRVYRLVHYLLDEGTTICKDDLSRLSGGLKTDTAGDAFYSQLKKKDEESNALVARFGRNVVRSTLITLHELPTLREFINLPSKVLAFWDGIFSHLNDQTKSRELVLSFYREYKSFYICEDSLVKQEILRNRLISLPDSPRLWLAGLQEEDQVLGNPVDNFGKRADMVMFKKVTDCFRGYYNKHTLYDYMNTKGYLEELNRKFGKKVIDNNIQALPYLFLMLNNNLLVDRYGYKQENLCNFWKEVSSELVQRNCNMVSICDYGDSEKMTGTLGELMFQVSSTIYNVREEKKRELLKKRILCFAIPICQKYEALNDTDQFLTVGFDCEQNADFTKNADKAFVEYFHDNFPDSKCDDTLKKCMAEYVTPCSDTSVASQTPTPFQFFLNPRNSGKLTETAGYPISSIPKTHSPGL